MKAGLRENSESSGVSRFAPLPQLLRAALRGSGQVIFLGDGRTGALNFLAIFVAAFLGGASPAAALGALVGTASATLAALVLGADRERLLAGLYGFNSLLVGLALPLFLAPGPMLWLLVVAATALSALVTLASEEWLRPWGLPAVTFPFVVTSWIVLAAAPFFPGLGPAPAPVAAESVSIAALLAAAPAAFDAPFAILLAVLAPLRAILASVSQVFLIDNPLSGALFLVALFVASRRCAAFAFAGAVVANAIAFLLGASHEAILHGLWGYSAVLTAPAIGCIFLKPGVGAASLALMAVVFTVLLQGAIASFMATFALPALTFPFVVATLVTLLGVRACRRGQPDQPGAS